MESSSGHWGQLANEHTWRDYHRRKPLTALQSFGALRPHMSLLAAKYRRSDECDEMLAAKALYRNPKELGRMWELRASPVRPVVVERVPSPLHAFSPDVGVDQWEIRLDVYEARLKAEWSRAGVL